LCNSLLQKLEGIQASLEKGLFKSCNNKLDAFINHVADQAGNKIDADAAASLITDAQWVIDNTDMEVAAHIAYWAEVVAPIVNEAVGATNIDLPRDYNAESIMGDIVTDSMRWKADLYDDSELNGSVEIAFTNPGGLRADILIPDGAALPYTITWGDTFDVLPFGNTLYLMDLTGSQIQDLLDQAATLYKGILQTSGASWDWYNDDTCSAPSDCLAYNVKVGGVPLVSTDVYRVVTNNFLAGGQDGWITFAEGINRWDTYYDMQQGFVEYIGMLEVIDAEDVPMGRIVRLDEPPP
jgi:2',3'-cyclic-nucleotide 2'-phosphodiesterase (5'-nucleotidase family)